MGPRKHLTLTYRDPRTGKEYGTRAELAHARRLHAKHILANFETLLAERTLGQDAWEQLPGETPLAFQRFHAYLTMEPGPRGERALRRLAPRLQVLPKRLEEMASHYHWRLRAAAYDRHLLAQDEIIFRQEKTKAAGRQARLGLRLQRIAGKGAELLAQNPDRLEAMSPLEITKMAEAGQRMERLAMGDSTENTDSRIQLVWEGPKPSWAPEQEAPAAPLALPDGQTIEGQP